MQDFERNSTARAHSLPQSQREPSPPPQGGQEAARAGVLADGHGREAVPGVGSRLVEQQRPPGGCQGPEELPHHVEFPRIGRHELPATSPLPWLGCGRTRPRALGRVQTAGEGGPGRRLPTIEEEGRGSRLRSPDAEDKIDYFDHKNQYFS